jgi:hypothetical protein
MQAVLQQLTLLPALQTLGLPAALLCTSCCNQGHGAATAHTHLLRVIQLLACRPSAKAACTSISEGDDSSCGPQGSLQRLAFLDVQVPDHSSCYAEECWQHPKQHQDSIQERFEALQEQQQHQSMNQLPGLQAEHRGNDQYNWQQQHDVGFAPLVTLELHLGRVSLGGLLSVSHHHVKEDPMWGVYGPAGW